MILLPHDFNSSEDFQGEIYFSDIYYNQIRINDIDIINGESYNFGNVSVNDTFYIELDDGVKLDTLNLIFTPLSTVVIFTDQIIKDEPKTLSLLYINDLNSKISHVDKAGIEIRGATSQTFPKVSYDIEIWDNFGSTETSHKNYFDLREDDDWILDAMYTDLSLSRNLFAMIIWSEFATSVNIMNQESKLDQSG